MPYLPRFEGLRWLKGTPKRKARLLASWTVDMPTVADPAQCYKYKFSAVAWIGRLQLFKSYIFWNPRSNLRTA